MTVYHACDLWNTTWHWSTVCWTLRILMRKLDSRAAITCRCDSIGHLEIVEKTLNLRHVHLVWDLARTTNDFRWVDVRSVGTVGRLVSSALRLGRSHDMLRWVCVLVRVWTTVSGGSSLLNEVLELILHGRDVVVLLSCLVDTSYVDDWVVRILASDLDTCLLCCSVCQFLDESGWGAWTRFRCCSLISSRECVHHEMHSLLFLFVISWLLHFDWVKLLLKASLLQVRHEYGQVISSASERSRCIGGATCLALDLIGDIAKVGILFVNWGSDSVKKFRLSRALTDSVSRIVAHVTCLLDQLVWHNLL